MAGLVLSDGIRSVDLLNDTYFSVLQDDLQLPVVVRDDVFAEGSDSEGRTRVRTRPTNSTAGSIGVQIKADSSANLWSTLDNLQELVESAHRNKGSVAYTAIGATTAVTYDLESISLSEVEQSGIEIAKYRCHVTITFESKPYGRLDQVWLGTFTNLTTNPGFETNTTGWTTSTATLTRVTDMFKAGSASGYVANASGTGHGIVFTSVVTVSASTAYGASAWVKARATADVGKQIKIRLEELTAASANVGQSETTITLSNQWQRLSVARQFGATGVRAKVHFLNVTSAAMGWVVDEVNLWASEVLSGPIDYFTVDSVPGQVPAWGELDLKDLSSVNRNHIEVGYQASFDSSNPEPILLNLASGLTALGGSSNTRASSYSANIIRAALATSAIAVCKAASQPHFGLWKIRTRVYPSTNYVRVRLAWRSGDGAFTKEKWQSVPNSAGWYDLDLGTIDITKLPSGHTCEFRIEALSSSGSATVDVDTIECIPADSYTKLRGSTSPETGSGAIVAMDDFSTQTAGAVTGKTPLLVPAGTYAGAGDTDDFTVDTTNKWIYRTAVSDSALNNGRYLRAGSSTLAATIITGDISVSSGSFSDDRRFGLMLRYVDTSNWLACVYIYGSSGSTVDGRVCLIKRVAGTETVLATSGNISGILGGSWRTLNVGADASGNVIVYEGPRGGALAPTLLVLADTHLATAGTLASGGYGFYDAITSGTATNRFYDNLSVSTLATSATIVSPALNSGQGTKLLNNNALTDSATAGVVGQTPIREGQYLRFQPATRNTFKSRIVVKARRDDTDAGYADSGIADNLSAEWLATPRVHVLST